MQRWRRLRSKCSVELGGGPDGARTRGVDAWGGDLLLTPLFSLLLPSRPLSLPRSALVGDMAKTTMTTAAAP